MSLSSNKLGLIINTDIKDYPFFTIVDNKKASGFADDINISQFETLIKFKEACINQNLLSNFDYFDDFYLLKFLRARKFDLEKTIKMFKNFIEWRKKEDVDNIEKNFHFREKIELQKVYPHGCHKVDKKGRPVYYQLISKIDIDKIFKITTEERLVRHFIQESEDFMKYKFHACSKMRGKHIDQFFTILDLEGIGLKHLIGSTRNVLMLSMKLGQDYYPENMAKMFMINVSPFFGVIYTLVKNFLDKKTTDKIELLGKEYREKLLEYVDDENLPYFFGGKCTCPNVEGGCLFSECGPWNPDGKFIIN